jgi:hypothetical protein
MKRIFISVLCLSAALAAGAQTMYDALNFSENNYAGTARTIGLNNAVTALGSDLGTIGINPAGSAVAGYSQFTISPSMVFSATDADFYDDNDRMTNNSGSRSRMALPNFAGTFVLETGRNRGLKSMTFGLVSNTTNNWLDRFDAMAGGSVSSLFGAEASYAQAAGYDPSMLASSAGYDNYRWQSVSAYQSGLISDFGNNNFVGATEQVSQLDDGTYEISTAGYLDRKYSRKVSGTKYDIVFNYAMNFSDRLFVGVNLGFPCGHYAFSESQNEVASDPSEFTFSYDTGEKVSFMQATNSYAYSASLSGIYAKVGVIWLPIAGLRLGAAVQTPTAMEITERYQVSNYSLFSNSENRATSPQGEYSYNLYMPWRYNLGAAYTIGRYGLVSVDYERVNYRNMRYEVIDDGYSYTDSFADVNNEIKTYAGASNMLRAGLEVKPTSKLAVRLGYALTTKDTDFVDTKVQSVSFGVGYSSDSAFFCDFAVRGTQYPVSYYSLYTYYNTDGSVNSDFATPEIAMTRSLYEFVATFGWRF